MNQPVSLFEASKFWLKLGFISFGGPAGQIATVHQELVENKRWISEKRFLHALNFCMILPGPEALQLVIYIGWLLHKRIGGIIAGLFFILPALCLLIALSWLYINFGNTYLLSGIFFGLKPAVTAIVIAAAFRIGKRILLHQDHWIIAGLTFLAISIFNAPFPALILIAALLGIYLAKKIRTLLSRLAIQVRITHKISQPSLTTTRLSQNMGASHSGVLLKLQSEPKLPGQFRFYSASGSGVKMAYLQIWHGSSRKPLY